MQFITVLSFSKRKYLFVVKFVDCVLVVCLNAAFRFIDCCDPVEHLDGRMDGNERM